MTKNKMMRTGVSSVMDLVDGSAALGLGVGNVYYVIQTTNNDYTAFVRDRQFTYPDGTSAVHGTIQAALDATVAERNDYVIVMPDSDDYDITAALTMTKKSVHLIGAGGMTGYPGATNSVRVHQNTAATACLTLSEQACEVAGIFWKAMIDSNGIDISAGAHCANVHNNFIALATTVGSATMYGILASGESTNMTITQNFIQNYSPAGTSKTIGGGIVLANGTRALIADNLITTGGFGTTMSVGIGCSGAQIVCIKNWLIESKSGSPASSTFTLGISAANDTVLFENRVSMAVANIANAINGMHADCAVMNYGTDAAGGDTILS